MDPYCTFTIGREKARSTTKHKAGRDPVWNESFSMRVVDLYQQLIVQIFDYDKFKKDDFIGSCSIALNSIPKTAQEKWFPLRSSAGKDCGQVQLRLQISALAGASKRPLNAQEMGRALQAFNRLDNDGDGQLTKTELMTALQQIDRNFTERDAAALLLKVDSDGNGIITIDEFLGGILDLTLDLSMLEQVAPPAHRLSSAGLLTIPAPTVAAPSIFPWEIDATELQLKKQLGSGTFGVVYLGAWRGAMVAVKKLNNIEMNPDIQKSFHEEVDVLSKIRHPNCLLFLGASTKGSVMTIVTEFCSGGALDDLLRKGPLEPAMFKKIARGIAVGVNYLHLTNPPIIHRDLKPGNVLLGDGNVPKVADFGLSVVLDMRARQKMQICGTPNYMAPEIWGEAGYDHKVDVFAYGMLLYEMVFRQTPFIVYTDPYEIGRRVCAGERPQFLGAIPTQLKTFIEQCWHKAPSGRPSFAQVIATLDEMFPA
eukprot:TRINITY_DN3077_c0_g1_i1.p1 TRINITY_DN3077_c0_g1~~TRINITY_DN3077_c0_g1_i1.p1  ORF type:complete len:513 (+),score=124.30 TRINITY_DN3077_c0_g1_i1:97-1539(+)